MKTFLDSQYSVLKNKAKSWQPEVRTRSVRRTSKEITKDGANERTSVLASQGTVQEQQASARAGERTSRRAHEQANKEADKEENEKRDEQMSKRVLEWTSEPVT